jgi:hypothetical protein
VSSVQRLAPRFVDNVPEALKAGVLYVAPEHGVMMHLCACGCGNEVSLPLSRIDWRLTFDGETISVSPSVGNWSLPCRSHYVIDHSHVRWAGDWSDEEIANGRNRDRRRREPRHVGIETPVKPQRAKPGPTKLDEPAIARHEGGLFTVARRWLSALRKRR